MGEESKMKMKGKLNAVRPKGLGGYGKPACQYGQSGVGKETIGLSSFPLLLSWLV
jgi:hypothetical protein